MKKIIQNQDGLTLVELMTAVSIALLLTGTGMATFISQKPHYELKAATRDFIHDIRLARQQAVSENRQYAVQFLSPTSYRVVRGDRNTIRQSGAFTPFLVRDFRGNSASRPHVVLAVPLGAPIFHPDGLISSWDGIQGGYQSSGPDEVLFISTDNETKTVSVSRLGRIQVQ